MNKTFILLLLACCRFETAEEQARREERINREHIEEFVKNEDDHITCLIGTKSNKCICVYTNNNYTHLESVLPLEACATNK